MDCRTLISNLIDSLVWPAVTIGIVLLFKREIADLLAKIIKIKHKDTEVDFSDEIKKAKNLNTDEDDSKLTKIDSSHEVFIEQSPRGAVLEAWLRVEKALKDYADRHHCPFTDNRNINQIMMNLEIIGSKEGASLGKGTMAMLAQLHQIRNSAVHLTDSNISHDEARDFVKLSNRIIEKIELA